MLQVSYIREHQAEVIERLSKRTNEANSLIETVLKLDETRRGLQTKVDVISSELNIISNEIGEFFKTGQVQKANDFKQKTTDLKNTKARLSEELNLSSDSLQALLYKIPNLPNAIVPKGLTEDDNEEIFSSGIIPTLSESATPHWELAKKI
jgi:seryl-tRNA synthetase